MGWKSRLARWVGDHDEQMVSAGIIVAVVGAALAIESHSIIVGLVSAALTAVGLWALWPVLKRSG